MIYNKRSAKPHFTLTPHDYDSDEGSTITLDCAAAGQPKPEIAWTRDDLQLQESPRFKISPEGTLTIINLEREDTGTYKCTASNYIGIITAVAQVRVNGSEIVLFPKVLPTFVTTPENLTTKSEVWQDCGA
ncbi:peroxidasin-like [Nilaparvata lugens]|uniref:peroxidasin-like n=1 Tax=Nilaparvata lugens TaxID=108931 RepID=UPI00193E741A|nr:peroxidasin-like [Nilaparvata lugens]